MRQTSPKRAPIGARYCVLGFPAEAHLGRVQNDRRDRVLIGGGRHRRIGDERAARAVARNVDWPAAYCPSSVRLAVVAGVPLPTDSMPLAVEPLVSCCQFPDVVPET